MKIKSIGNFVGIETANDPALSDLMRSVEECAELMDEHGPRFAFLTALEAVNTGLVAASTKCTLAAPPADIDMVPSGTGKLIYRCQHARPHSWNLGGEQL